MKDKPDRKLDCIGLYCPEPVFKTRMELDEMKKGEVLEVVADDPAAEEGPAAAGGLPGIAGIG